MKTILSAASAAALLCAGTLAFAQGATSPQDKQQMAPPVAGGTAAPNNTGDSTTNPATSPADKNQKMVKEAPGGAATGAATGTATGGVAPTNPADKQEKMQKDQ